MPDAMSEPPAGPRPRPRPVPTPSLRHSARRIQTPIHWDCVWVMCCARSFTFVSHVCASYGDQALYFCFQRVSQWNTSSPLSLAVPYPTWEYKQLLFPVVSWAWACFGLRVDFSFGFGFGFGGFSSSAIRQHSLSTTTKIEIAWHDLVAPNRRQ